MDITGSIQKKNGRYHMVINMPTENGKTKPKWETTGLKIRGNKKQAEKMLSERLSELNKFNLPYCKISIADYFSEWLQKIQKEVRPNTYRSYYGNMTNHIIPYFKQNKIQLQELTPFDLEEYYKLKLQPNSKINSDEALSATTIKHHHQNISKALADAVRKGLIMANPAASAKTPKSEKFKGEFLNQKQVNEMLVLFRDSVIELPVFLCSVYGFRRSEVLGLKWHNIDFESKSITIAETLQQSIGGNYTDTPKTESSYRTLPMTNEVYTALIATKSLQEERKQLMGNYYVQNDYVCTWQNGAVISPNYLTRTFKSIISKSNLPQIRLHDLRHSAASNLLDMGFSVVQVADWLGHSSSATTLNFYAHAEKRSKMDIANALESAFQTQSVR